MSLDLENLAIVATYRLKRHRTEDVKLFANVLHSIDDDLGPAVGLESRDTCASLLESKSESSDSSLDLDKRAALDTDQDFFHELCF